MPEPTLKADVFNYPPEQDRPRIDRYQRYDLLFRGQHFEAFNIRLENELDRRWGHLRYVVANFAGLISKVMADMLFSEPISLKFTSEEAQKFGDAVMFENKMHLQNYESALSNSARGDAGFKLRIGKRNPNDERDSIIIESFAPQIYFPHLESQNINQKPQMEELAWIVVVGGREFVRKEIHYPGLIQNELWSYNRSEKKLVAKEPWSAHFPGIPELQETGVNRNLIVHIPNWRTGSDYFGLSDYFDLEPLFFALNNRITKIDTVLDKHTDPILAVPEGVLDEDGKVRKEHIGVFEVTNQTEGGLDKPEYIVWDANLDSAFTEIDKLVDMLFMVSEVSPATLGMDKDGAPASGRALKLKLLRTIAKKQRKQLYYDQALKEVITLAQELAKAWGIQVVGQDAKPIKAPANIETPDIEWSDGIVNDSREAAEEEEIRLRSGTTSVKDAIIRLDNVDEKTAEQKAKEITEETGLALPLTGPGQPKEEPAATPKPKE